MSIQVQSLQTQIITLQSSKSMTKLDELLVLNWERSIRILENSK